MWLSLQAINDSFQKLRGLSSCIYKPFFLDFLSLILIACHNREAEEHQLMDNKNVVVCDNGTGVIFY